MYFILKRTDPSTTHYKTLHVVIYWGLTEKGDNPYQIMMS